MKVTRRDFLKYCIGSAAALGLDFSVLGSLEKALAASKGPPIIWLNAANCTGCTVSLANLVGSQAPVDVGDLLVNTINLAFHPNLMGASGDLAVESLKNAASGAYVLVVDGGIPTAFGGHTCMLWTEPDGREVTALEAVTTYGPGAAAILCVGTCSSFGGMAGAYPNPTGIKNVSAVVQHPLSINIPGCPPHPDWMVWTIAQLLAGKKPALDSVGRPYDLFGGERRNVHENCPRRETEEAEIFGTEGRCLEELGCKGPQTQGDCPVRRWNNRTNWCVGANAICLGCTEKGFPDRFSPFYKET